MKMSVLVLTLLFVLALTNIVFADSGGGKVEQPGESPQHAGGSAAEERVTTPGGVEVWVCAREQSAKLD